MANASRIPAYTPGLYTQNNQTTENAPTAYAVTAKVNKLKHNTIPDAGKNLNEYKTEIKPETKAKLLGYIKKRVKNKDNDITSENVATWIKVDDELHTLLNDRTKYYLQKLEIKAAKDWLDNLNTTIEQEVLNETLEKICQQLLRDKIEPSDFEDNINRLLIMGADFTRKSQNILDATYNKKLDKIEKKCDVTDKDKEMLKVLSAYTKSPHKLKNTATRSLGMGDTSYQIFIFVLCQLIRIILQAFYGTTS